MGARYLLVIVYEPRSHRRALGIYVRYFCSGAMIVPVLFCQNMLYGQRITHCRPNRTNFSSSQWPMESRVRCIDNILEQRRGWVEVLSTTVFCDTSDPSGDGSALDIVFVVQWGSTDSLFGRRTSMIFTPC